jgi:hypothetical protein
VRYGGPHSGAELRAKRLHELVVLLGHLEIALCDEDLAVSGLHSQEPHRGDYDKAIRKTKSLL